MDVVFGRVLDYLCSNYTIYVSMKYIKVVPTTFTCSFEFRVLSSIFAHCVLAVVIDIENNVRFPFSNRCNIFISLMNLSLYVLNTFILTDMLVRLTGVAKA